MKKRVSLTELRIKSTDIALDAEQQNSIRGGLIRNIHSISFPVATTSSISRRDWTVTETRVSEASVLQKKRDKMG